MTEGVGEGHGRGTGVVDVLRADALAVMDAENGSGSPEGAQPPLLVALVGELKILTKDRRTVRFGDVMNYAQIDFLYDCAYQLERNGNIRSIILKARQIGISTVVEAIIFVLSMLFDDLGSLIVSFEASSSEAILKMTKRYFDTYVDAEFYETKYSGKKQLSWTTGSNIEVATAKNVDAGRSKTIHMLHATEVAMWDEPEELLGGLRNSMPPQGLTCIFVESTAKGVGNYFHRECNRAMLGDSEFTFKFYPWYKHPEYDALYIPKSERDRYAITDLDREEVALRNMGIPDSKLIWRRYAIKENCQGDVNTFHQEYPTTPHEAFISTGNNVFPLPRLIEHYRPRHGVTGRLVSNRGKIKFIEDDNGPLTLFAHPADRDWGVYLLGADPTHTMAGDYACIQVINRRTLEQVAVYRRKIDPIQFGKDAQMLGMYFNEGMIAPEREGPGYATIGCIVGDGYHNVYKAHNIAKTPGHPTADQFGWSTNSATKHLAISRVLKMINEPVANYGGNEHGLIIHDLRTLTELRDYVVKADGTGYTNSDGSEYDDGVMALAIACAVHHIEPPPPAYEERAEHSLPANIVNRPVKQGITSGTFESMEPVDEPTTPDVPIEDSAPWESWGRD